MAQDAKRDQEQPEAQGTEDKKLQEVTASVSEPGTSDPKQPGERDAEEVKDERA